MTASYNTGGSAITGTLFNYPDGNVLTPSGTFTCNGATPVTVANANYGTYGTNILITLKTVGGTVGALPAVKTVTSGTGFTVAGTASDTSVYYYTIF